MTHHYYFIPVKGPQLGVCDTSKTPADDRYAMTLSANDTLTQCRCRPLPTEKGSTLGAVDPEHPEYMAMARPGHGYEAPAAIKRANGTPSRAPTRNLYAELLGDTSA